MHDTPMENPEQFPDRYPSGRLQSSGSPDSFPDPGLAGPAEKPKASLSGKNFWPDKKADHLLLAPMVGLTHRAFRTLVFAFGGLDFAYTEMASAGGYLTGSMEDRFWTDCGPRSEHTGLQFYTVKPEHLEEACRRVSLLDKDARPAAIDINFACSAPHILRAGGGADWMKRPAEAGTLVSLARAAWPGILGAKIRLGVDEDYPRLLDFCLNLATAGLDMLVIHPRLDSQKFRRTANHDFIRRLVEDLPIPVYGNGDVRKPSDWRRMKSHCSPAGVMIGREALRRPWIFTLIRGVQKDPDFEITIDRKKTGMEFFNLVQALYPEGMALKMSRAFFLYYCDTLSFAHHLKWKMANSPDTATMLSIFDDYFKEVPQDQFLQEKDWQV